MQQVNKYYIDQYQSQGVQSPFDTFEQSLNIFKVNIAEDPMIELKHS